MTRCAAAWGGRRAVVLVRHDARRPDDVAIQDQHLGERVGVCKQRTAKERGRMTSFRKAVGGGE